MKNGFLTSFEVRWNDLDANRHLANTSFVEYMVHNRMKFLYAMGFNDNTLIKHNIGPVVFNESISYFKEVRPGGKVYVALHVTGLSEDGMFFGFRHTFYNAKGQNVAVCDIRGGWFNLDSRKLTSLPAEELAAFSKQMPKSEDFKVFTSEDTRTGHRPVGDIEL